MFKQAPSDAHKHAIPHTHTHTHTHMQSHSHVHVHKDPQTDPRMRLHVCTHMHKCAYKHTTVMAMLDGMCDRRSVPNSTKQLARRA